MSGLFYIKGGVGGLGIGSHATLSVAAKANINMP